VSAKLGSRPRVFSSAELLVALRTSSNIFFRVVPNPLCSRPNTNAVETHNHARVLRDSPRPSRQKPVVAAEATRNIWTTICHREPKEQRTSGPNELKLELAKTVERFPLNLGVVDIVSRPKWPSMQHEERPVEETEAECETCHDESDSA